MITPVAAGTITTTAADHLSYLKLVAPAAMSFGHRRMFL